MKEKLIQFFKTRKLLICVLSVVVVLAVAAVIGIGLMIQPTSEEKTPSKRPTIDRVVMGPNNSILYYNDYESVERAIEEKIVVDGSNETPNAGHLITSETNNYVKLTFNENKYCAFQAKSAGAELADTVCVQLSLSTDTAVIPSAQMRYPYDRNTTNPNFLQSLFKIRNNGDIVVENTFLGTEATLATIEQGKWVRIGIQLTLSSGTCALFVYDDVSNEWIQKGSNVLKPSVLSPSYIRMQINQEDKNLGGSLLIDDYLIHTGVKFMDPSTIDYKDPIKVTTAEDVAMVHPELSDMGDEGIAVMAGKDFAYVGEEKVSLSEKSTLTEVGGEEEISGIKAFFRTIINFFKKLFGIAIEKQPEPYKDILVSGDFIEKYLKVKVEDTSKQYALTEIAKSAGKNVVYDERGMLVVTEPKIKLHAKKNVKLLTLIYGLFETGEAISNYAAAPIFNQDTIDNAIDTFVVGYADPFLGASSYPTEKSVNALYYLTLVARSYPDAKHSTKDITVVDSALERIRICIKGGGEPFASPGCWFSHAIFASSMTLVKNTDVIYSQLTEDERARIDLAMEALAISANWYYNDANEYTTSFNLQGNMHDNANYRNSYLSILLNASLYFGADEMDKLFVNFDYDKYMARFEEYEFTNIYNTWIDIGYNKAKRLMENGGDAYLVGFNWDYYHSQVGAYAGTGKGVKLPFDYNEFGSRDVTEIFSKYLVEYTYAWKTISEYGTPDTATHCFILSDNKVSPMEGKMGMMLEYATTDSGDIRSRSSYVYDSFEILVGVYTNMKLLAGWDSSTQRMCEMDNRIWVGNEDLIFKLTEGYQGRSIGSNYEEYEYTFTRNGYEFVKEIWYNFHSMEHKDITVLSDPEVEPLSDIPLAQPKEGDGLTAPDGAIQAVVKGQNSIITRDSYTRIVDEGKAYETGRVEFEVVIPDRIDQNYYNVVLMLGQVDKGLVYKDMNMLIQFYAGWINVYNGAASVNDYIPTDIRFDSNYRFKVEMTWDAPHTSYTVKIKQTWPETKKEISYTSRNLKYRSTGQSIDGVNAIALVKNDIASPMWLESFQLIETGNIVNVIEKEPDLKRIPGVYYQNDFNDEDRKLSYNANSSGKGNEFITEWNEDTKNGWANLEMACEKDGYFRPKITGATLDETIVVEMKLSTDGTTPDSKLMYPYKAKVDAEKTSNNTILSINENKIAVGGQEIGSLKAGKWTRLGIIFKPKTGECSIYIYNSSKGQFERSAYVELNPSVIAPTYLNYYVAGNQVVGRNLLIDDVSIYEGTAFHFDKKIDTTGVVIKSTRKNNIETPDGYYYYSDYNVENCNVTYDAQIKSRGGYEYSQKRDLDNNGYLSIDSIAGTVNSDFFRAQVEGATNGDYIVTEIDLRAGANGTPRFTFMYDFNKVNGSTKAKNLFSVNEKTGKVIGGNALVSSLSNTKWTKIGLILNKKTGNYTLYEYDETTKTFVWKAKGSGSVATEEGYPTFMGLNLSAPSSKDVTRSIHVDNFYVYGSKTAAFKNGTTGTEPEFDGVYYSQNYSDADLWDVGINTYNGGGYDYTHKVDADGNGYVKMVSKTNSTEYDYFRVNLAGLENDPNRSLVVEFEMRAGADGVPNFSFQFEPESGKTKTVFTGSKDSLQLLGSETLLSTLLKEQWTRIGMILNLDTGVYTLYEYDKESDTYTWKEEGVRQLKDGYPTWMRLSFSARDAASTQSLDVDNFKIYSGTAFEQGTTGVKPDFDGIYYSQDYNVAKFITSDATTKSNTGYDFAQGLEVDGNGYLKITSKEDTNLDSYFRANVTGASDEDSIVAEMKLRAGESGIPQFRFYLDRTTAARNIFGVDDSGEIIYAGDKTIAPITADEWTQVGFILNRKTGEYAIYRNIEGTYIEMATGSTTFASGKPTYFGFNISAPGEGNAREFHVDDFVVYAGTEFRNTEIAVSGDINVNTVIADGLLSVTNTDTKDTVANCALSAIEKTDVSSGENASLTFNVSGVADSSSEKSVITNALNGRTCGAIFALNLTKQIGEDAIKEVTSTSDKLHFTATIPDELINTNADSKRTYEMIRVDDGVATEVACAFDNANSQITFATDKFGVFAILYKDVVSFNGYMEDFNDEKSFEDYSEQIAVYAKAHTSTNEATKNDFYGKRTEGENSYIYMRSSGKLVSAGTYNTSFTFSNIDVEIGDKPLWIEMDLKALGKEVFRYQIYVNNQYLFYENGESGTFKTNDQWLSADDFYTLSLKFDNGKVYAYCNGAKEIQLNDYAIDKLESFQIKLYPDTADVIATGNAGLCVDNVAVYTSDTNMDVFAKPTGIKINQGNIGLQLNSTRQLTATVETEGMTTPAIQWISDDESVATISNGGLLTAKKRGKVTITAKSGEVSDTCTVLVGINKLFYLEDFNDKKLFEDYSGQIAAYAKAHTSTNEATKNDFYGKRTEGENSYIYMRSSGKLVSAGTYNTSFTFSNIDVEIGDKPLWIEMDLKALGKEVFRYQIYVNNQYLFYENGESGTFKTNDQWLSVDDFYTLSLKFDNGKVYAYCNGAKEIQLNDYAIDKLESFQIKLYPDATDASDAGNAGLCIDNVAVYTSDSSIKTIENTTKSLHTIFNTFKNILMSGYALLSKK